MRKLNLRWLVGVVLGSIGLGVFGLILHEFQMWRIAPTFIREAKRAQAANRPVDAVNYLRRYVNLVPNDTEGLILYGFQLADLNNVSAAYLTLERAIRREPDRTDVRQRLVGLARRLGRNSEAIDHLKDHLLKKAPQDAELFEELSRCQYANGDFESAVESLKSAVQYSPKRIDDYITLASLQLERLERPNDAAESINQMMSNNSDNYLAYLQRGRWWMHLLSRFAGTQKASRDPGAPTVNELRNKAEADAEDAREMAPEDPEVLFFAASVAQSAGRIDKVREHSEKGLQLHPSDIRFHVLLADIETASGKPNIAIDLLRECLVKSPKNFTLEWKLASLLIDQGAYPEAEKIIGQAREQKHSETIISFLESRIKIRRSEWLPAIRQLEKIRVNANESPELLKQVNFWLGVAYRETNSPDQQINCFRRAVDLDPNYGLARMALAESFVAANRLPEAIVEYKRLVNQPQPLAVSLLGLANALLTVNRQKPTNDQDWSEFDQVLKLIEQQDSLEAQAAILRFEQTLAKQDRKNAEESITSLREKNTDRIEFWKAEINLALSSKDWDRAEQLLRQTEDKFGDTPAVRLAKAQFLVQRSGAEAGDALHKLAEPNSTWTQQQQIQNAGELAPLFLSISDFDESERLGTFVAQAEPVNLRTRQFLIDVAIRARRRELLDRVLEEIRGITGEGALWHYGQAIRLTRMETKKDPQTETKEDLETETKKARQNAIEALSHLRKARAERPTWERIPILTAEIQDSQGDTRAAAEQYLEAIRLGERNPTVAARALYLLVNDRRLEEADRLIQELHHAHVSFTNEMSRVEIDLALQTDKKNEASKAVDDLIKRSPQDQDPVWLGQVFGTLGRYDDAKTQFGLAVKAHPKDPKSWASLVQMLALLKEPEKAEAVIEEAKAAIPPDQVLPAIAHCYEVLGKPDLARSNYQAALEKSPDDIATNRAWVEFLLKTGAALDAESALKKVLNASKGDDESSQDNRRWAQRMLSLAVLAQGGRDHFNEALAMIDLNLKAKNLTPSEDLRMKSIILSRSPLRSQRQQAIEIIEKQLIPSEINTSAELDDRYRLARLQMTIGETAKSRVELRKVILARKSDPRYLATYVQLCLQTGEIAEADAYFESLRKTAPEDPLTRELETQLLFKNSKYSKIVEVLKTIDEQGIKQKEKPVLLAARKLWIAKRFEEFARLLNQAGKTSEAARFAAEAESYYTQYTQLQPQEVLALAEFLGGTSQIDRALDLLQEHGSKSSVGRVAGVSTAVRRNSTATPAQLTRLQGLLKENFESHKSALALKLLAADLMSWRGDYAGAKSHYAEVLRQDSRNVIALNNLAVVIALTGGDQAEAMRLVEKAIENGGPIDALLDTRGLVHLAAERPQEAFFDFQKAISESENAERLFHEALASARMKQFAMAKETLKRATEDLKLSENDLHPLERAKLNKLRADLRADLNGR